MLLLESVQVSELEIQEPIGGDIGQVPGLELPLYLRELLPLEPYLSLSVKCRSVCAELRASLAFSVGQCACGRGEVPAPAGRSGVPDAPIVPRQRGFVKAESGAIRHHQNLPSHLTYLKHQMTGSSGARGLHQVPSPLECSR